MSIMRQNFELATRKLYAWVTGSATPTLSPAISGGDGAPTASDANGSLWLRRNGPAALRRAGAWWPVPVLLYAAPSASTAITGTQENETAFDRNVTVPADMLLSGSVLRIRGAVTYTATTGTETHAIIVKIGSVAILTYASLDPSNNQVTYFDMCVQVRTVGASGTIYALGTAAGVATSGTTNAPVTVATEATLDTTVANLVAVYIDRQTSATDTDSARLDALIVELL
jgi:hypothetical protein